MDIKTDQLISNLVERTERVEIWTGPLPQYAQWFLLVGFTASVALYTLGLRPDFDQQILSGSFLLEILPLAFTGFSAAYLTLLYSIPGRDHPWLKTPVVLGSVTISLLFLIVAFFWELQNDPAWALHLLPMIGGKCALHISMVSVPPLVFLLYTARRAAPLKYWLVGGLAALSSTAMGALVVNLHCNLDQALHHFLSSFLTAFLFVTVVILVSKRLFKII